MALILTPVPGNASRVECDSCPARTIVSERRPRVLRRLVERLGPCPSCGR